MCIHSPLVEDKSLLLLQITSLVQVLNRCYILKKKISPTDDPCEDPQNFTGVVIQWFFSLIFVPVFLLKCKLLYAVMM